MTQANAKKVLRFAINHPSFRSALRNDPREAIESYKVDLALDNAGLTIEEEDALVNFTDEEYEAFGRLAEALGDSVSGEVNGGVIF